MKRLRRAALILGLLVFPAILVFVGLRGFVVRNAVVTAELLQLRAPIDGNVAALAANRGLYLPSGGPAVTLTDLRADRRELEAIRLELIRAEAAIAARQADLAALQTLLDEVDTRLPRVLAGIQADLSLQQQVALASRAGLEARVTYLTKQSERARRLQGSAASQSTLEAAEADLATAQAELQALDLTIERLAQQQDYLDGGLLVTELTDDALSLLDSQRSLSARRQSGALELSLLQATQALLRARLEVEQHHLSLNAEATLALPPDSAVWEVLVAPGTDVVAGLPLLSYIACAERFVEAAVDDSTVELLTADHPVEVTLYGSDETMIGRVAAVYGSGGQVTRRSSLAAQLAELGASDAVVLIEIGDPLLPAREQRLCDVGRTAYVSFEGIGLLDPLLNRLF